MHEQTNKQIPHVPLDLVLFEAAAAALLPSPLITINLNRARVPLTIYCLCAAINYFFPSQIIFEESKNRVSAITNSSVEKVNFKSQQFIAKHKHLDDYKRVLHQRHRLKAVPVYEIQYIYKSHRGHFWLYGDAPKCYFPDYPESNLRRCAIC